MENATQALRIAAGILFALLILGLLVAFYNNMSEIKRYEQTQTLGEQAAEFNKQYDVYNRTLYGSELLSLVNKAENYNKTEVIDKGYPNLEVTVTFKANGQAYKTGEEYNINRIKQLMKEIENVIQEYGDRTVAGKKLSELALMRTNEREEFYDKNGIGNIRKKHNINITQYSVYKSEELGIKNKKYKCINVEYDTTTGRIIKMSYKEV